MKLILTLCFCLVFSLTALAQYSGKPLAENFTATNLKGESVNLEDLRGKVVVLTFWSTRCPICSSEIPKYNHLASKYEGKDVVFLGVSMENETMVNAYHKKKPFNFMLIPNGLGIIMQYAVKNKDGSFDIGYPSFFVINQLGEIEMKASGRGKVPAIDSTIENLLENS